jgi:hypothetical protein
VCLKAAARCVHRHGSLLLGSRQLPSPSSLPQPPALLRAPISRLRVPDFSRLGRKEALAFIQSFETELARRHPHPVEARRLVPLLTEGLRDLQRSHIPDNWL